MGADVGGKLFVRNGSLAQGHEGSHDIQADFDGAGSIKKRRPP